MILIKIYTFLIFYIGNSKEDKTLGPYCKEKTSTGIYPNCEILIKELSEVDLSIKDISELLQIKYNYVCEVFNK